MFTTRPVLSLISAGYRLNSPAEKAAIAGWIFGQQLLTKAEQALLPTTEGA